MMKTTFQIKIYDGKPVLTNFNDIGSDKAVVFCHGFRSSMIGPQRYFNDVMELLIDKGISVFRFDQHGSGGSPGNFKYSSFSNWLNATSEIVEELQAKGLKVGMFGQSMGGSTVIDTASKNKDVVCTVAWVPDPNIDVVIEDERNVIEEGGQLITAKFWNESLLANTPQALATIGTPIYIFQAENDEYVSAENHKAIENNLPPKGSVEMLKNHQHSKWTRDEADLVISKTVDYIAKQFSKH